MDEIEITKKLIAIPSYVRGKRNEKEIGNFIYRYLKQFPFLVKIQKQKVEGERFNVIASDGFASKLLLIGHLDTVEPRGWHKQNPLMAVKKSDRLYGLGSCDMKGGMAAILGALKEFKKTKGLMLLFYCDEEYNFKGMKRFVEGQNVLPRLAVSAEPTQLKIWNGARGIIKVSLTVIGVTAPASRLDRGKNAILGLLRAVDYLSQRLTEYKDKNLGYSTCNLAAISGGLNLGRDGKGNYIIDKRGDAVADIAKATLDIRVGHLKLNAQIIKNLLKNFLKEQGFQLTDFIVYHDLGAFYLRPFKLKKIELIIKKALGRVGYLKLTQMGYQDIQMLAHLGVPSFSFGPIGGNRHQAAEWIGVKSIKKTKEIYKRLILEYCCPLTF